jgi:hypothetical protein
MRCSITFRRFFCIAPKIAEESQKGQSAGPVGAIVRQELGPGVKWAMDRQTSYCHRIALECGRRAEKSTDEDVRQFLYRMRDNWLRVASGLDVVATAIQSGNPGRSLNGKTS